MSSDFIHSSSPIHLITSSAAHYDLTKKNERVRSAQDLRRLFMGLQRVLRPEIFVEAGANDAQTSIDLRTICPNTSIFAFEANPYNYRKFSSQIDFSLHNIVYENLAMTEKTGEIQFLIQIEVGGKAADHISERNSILARTEEDIIYENVKVPSTSIDDYFELKKGRFSFWIDVEGASGNVINGAKRTLTRTELLIIEVETKQYWKDQWLCHDVCAHLDKKNFIPIARDYEYKHQFNIIFIKKDILANPAVLTEMEMYHSSIAVGGRSMQT